MVLVFLELAIVNSDSEMRCAFPLDYPKIVESRGLDRTMFGWLNVVEYR